MNDGAFLCGGGGEKETERGDGEFKLINQLKPTTMTRVSFIIHMYNHPFMHPVHRNSKQEMQVQIQCPEVDVG